MNFIVVEDMRNTVVTQTDKRSVFELIIKDKKKRNNKQTKVCCSEYRMKWTRHINGDAIFMFLFCKQVK